MDQDNKVPAFVPGVFIFAGLAALGYLLGAAAIEFKEYERTVTVKDLSEREYEADIVIWPIQFTAASNDLAEMYRSIDGSTSKIRAFLENADVGSDEVTFSSPAIADRSAQQYGNQNKAEFRYTATQAVTVYSTGIALVRQVMNRMSDLGKRGIVFTGGNYEA